LKIFSIIILVSTLLLSVGMSMPVEQAKWDLEPVSLYHSGYEKGTEIISVQQSTLRAVLSNFGTGEADVLDVSRPEKLRRIGRFSLGLGQGEEFTSVAFHPSLDLFAAVVDAGIQRGRLEIRSASTGELVDHVETGFGSDAVVMSSDGRLVLVANEGEDFWFDQQKKQFFKARGSISIVHLDQNGQVEANNNLKLADVTAREGFVIEDTGHYLEVGVDWNGDGKISKQMDFDGNGLIEDKKVSLGHFEESEVFGSETKGERKIMIPISSHSPNLLEPEYIAISPDATKAYVTLQETNEVAVVNLINEKVMGYYNMGVTEHKADLTDDGWVHFDQSIAALREPDGIALTADGRYFMTADEGDTETSADAAQTLSGGRTISVFDAKTGKFVGDTGNQLDEVAFAHNLYLDSRSGKKGAEPEMLVSCDLEGTPWVAVGMERAGAVMLISLADPEHPKVEALGKIPGEDVKSPEGIAHFMLGKDHYLLTANETNGTVAAFKIVRKASVAQH
jgi:DNA-binding beta-propeller fold protein YncE